MARFGMAQRVHLFRGKFAKLPGMDVKRERAVAHALDLFHVMADFFKHAPDLPVFSFNQRNFIPGVGGVFHQADLRGGRVHWGSDGWQVRRRW